MANEFKIKKGLVVNGSGSTILDVQGSQGQLFSVTDQLSGSLFSVNDISGIPVLEAFSDTTVKIGQYAAEAIIVSGSNARMTGSLFGTASWAQNSLTASYFITSSVTSASYALTASSATFAASALTASYFVTQSVANATSASYAATASSADNFLVRSNLTASNALVTGTITAQTLVVSTVSSSVVYSSGSNIFGNSTANVQQFTGSLRVTGSGNHYIVGGNVGIGTASPVQQLDVRGNIYLPSSNFITYNNGDVELGVSGSYNFVIRTYTGAAMTEKVRVTSGGNVGIGTATPNAKLHVSGSNTDGLLLINSPASSSILVVSGSGNVGIGTATPVSQLHVQAPDSVTGTIFVKGGKNTVTSIGEINSQLDFGSNDTSINNTNNIGGRIASVTEISNGAYAGMAFYTFQQGRSPDLQEAVRITNAGNVGIGITNPTTKLHVSGTTGGLFEVDGAAAVNALYVSASGNVGIGTATPTLATLQVNGNVYATSYTGSLFGTSSWAQNSLTASYFLTSSVTSASYALTASSAIFATSALTASYFVTQSVTSASYALTASSAVFATSALTASYFLTSSVTSASYAATASSADNFLVRSNLTASNALVTGTITAQTLVVSTVSSSVVYSSGSNIFGNSTANIQQFTGSLRVTGSGNHYIVGGNVGIGTASPAEKLDVNGNIQIANAGYIKGSTYTGTKITIDNDLTLTANRDVYIDTGVVFKDGGNVGIGTTSPTAKLQVSGSNTDGLLLINSPASSSILVVSGSGNVGIGIATPSSKLHIYDGTNPVSLRIQRTTVPVFLSDIATGATTAGSAWTHNKENTSNGSLSWSTSANASYASAGILLNSSTSNSFITFYTANASNTNPSESVRITGDGSVGIGITTPTAKLHVSGTTGGVFEVDGAAAINALYVSSSGTVGIGTTTPAALLDVATSGTTGTTSMLLLKRFSGYGHTLFEQSYDSVFFANGKTLTLKNDSNTAFAHFAGNNAGTVTNLIIPSGSVTALSFTGSLFGTASWASNALTASYFLTSSVTSASYAATASSADNFLVRSNLTASNALINGTITAQTLVVSTVSSSVVYSSGSNTFGNSTANVQQFTGSLRVTGSGDHYIVGGNVGIGITNPTTKLHVSGTTGGVFEVDGAAAVNALYVSSSGNVGIGTTTPAALLNVVKNGDKSTIAIGNIASSTYSQLLMYGGATKYNWSIGAQYNVNNALEITPSTATEGTTFSTPVVTILQGGNVGIGTTTPTLGTLQVNGNVYATSYTGSLFGTASWATNAISSTTAATASYSTNFTVASKLTIDQTLTDYATVASSIVGANNLFTQATGSYTSAFFKYTAANGTNTRAGEVVAAWNGTTATYTDFSTVDIGDTSGVATSVSIVTGDVQFNITTGTSGWSIKSLATFM